MPHTNDSPLIRARGTVTRESARFLRTRPATSMSLDFEPTDSQAVLEFAAVFGGNRVTPCRIPGSAYSYANSPRPDRSVVYVNAPSNAISAWLSNNWGVNVFIGDWNADTELTVPTPWLDLHISPTTAETLFPRSFAIQGGSGGLILVQDIDDGPTRPVLPVERTTTPTRSAASGSFLVAFLLRHLGVLEPLTSGLRLTGAAEALTLSWDPPLSGRSLELYGTTMALLEQNVRRSQRVRLQDEVPPRTTSPFASPFPPLTLVDEQVPASLLVTPSDVIRSVKPGRRRVETHP
jgi:hypothetical protein